MSSSRLLLNRWTPAILSHLRTTHPEGCTRRQLAAWIADAERGASHTTLMQLVTDCCSRLRQEDLVRATKRNRQSVYRLRLDDDPPQRSQRSPAETHYPAPVAVDHLPCEAREARLTKEVESLTRRLDYYTRRLAQLRGECDGLSARLESLRIHPDHLRAMIVKELDALNRGVSALFGQTLGRLQYDVSNGSGSPLAATRTARRRDSTEVPR